MTRLIIPPLLLGVAVSLSGCRGKPSPPPIVPAEGVVILDGQPLPFARVEFVPDLKDFGAEMNSNAVTDEQGHFVLTCIYENKPGAAVAAHHVLVSEYTPDGMRGTDGRSQEKFAEYQARLKNRPIPDNYGVLSRSPVLVEVKAGQSTYEVRLSRDGR
jgi:hypothetical protein